MEFQCVLNNSSASSIETLTLVCADVVSSVLFCILLDIAAGKFCYTSIPGRFDRLDAFGASDERSPR